MKTKALTSVPKTAEGLRDALFDEINALRANKTTAVRARAISTLAAQVIDSLRVQIQHGRLINEAKESATMQLGSPLK